MQDQAHSFGYWLRRRRKALDLTQEALGERVSCSGFTIRKIEADERRPSRQLSERLAVALAVPEEERGAFLAAARALRAAERLALDGAPVGDASPSAPAAAAPAAAPSATDATPFIGRGNEYGLLIGLIARLAAGTGQAAIVEGEPGIGKSRLMREVARYAGHHGLPTLATHCYEIERAIPYQPVIELVTRALDRASPATLAAMRPVSLAELAALVPAVGERFPGLPRLSGDFPEARQARLSHAVGELLEALRGDRPLVLLVDDIQWADDASAQVLHYLARRALEGPILALYACRDEDLDADPNLARFVESLARTVGARRLRLARLTAADAQALVAAVADERLGAPGLAQRLHRETDGNPFFLVSILHSLAEGEIRLDGNDASMLPDGVRDAVRARLTHLPPETRPLLEMAAVLGRRFDFDTLLAVTRGTEAGVLAAMEAFVKRRLLREEPEGGVYDFTHDKLREVVYRDIGGARRRLLHRAVAEVLERTGETSAHEHHARLAEHYERAQEWSRALEHLVLAGERSQALFAMRDALHWLDRAVAIVESHPEAADLPRRLALYERRGVARAQAGQTQGAVADMRRVIAAARAANEREHAREALIQLGMAYRRADAYDDARACLAEALAESRAMGDERRSADTLYHLGTVAWSTGRNADAIRLHEEAVAICESAALSDLVAVQAYHGRGEAHFANSEPAAAIRCYTRSLELARAIGDKSYECENLMMIGHACLGTRGLGDYARAGASFDEALRIARAADLQWHMGPTLLGLDHLRACTGRYGEAWTGMQETLRWLESLRQVRYQLIAFDFIGHLLLDLDRDAQALEQLGRGLALARATGIGFWQHAIEAGAAIARARLGEGDPRPALEAALEASRANAERHLVARCLEACAEVALAQGDARDCGRFAAELLALAAPNGLRELEGVALRWQGEALLAEGRPGEAKAALDRAARIAQEAGRVRHQKDAQGALARAHDAAGDRQAARRHAARARAIADAMAHSAALSGLEPIVPGRLPAP